MNSLEKNSFYSFVALYLSSSFLFVLLSGYWYYSAQKNSLESVTYYKLEHFADKLSGLIINAHMMGETLKLPKEDEFEYSIVSLDDTRNFKEGYFQKDGYKLLVSSSPRKHLGIKYVIVRTQHFFVKLKELQRYVIFFMGLSFIVIGAISVLLAKLFMKPIHQRIEQIESFIQDVSHELNTPITALKMSASRAIKKGVYDGKILRNISISTKQLETIYNSLTYLNFDTNIEEKQELDLKLLTQRVVDYYGELSSAKQIQIKTDLNSCTFYAVQTRMELLLSNLLSNAIKYSMPESCIYIKLSTDELVVKDEGMGIEKEKLDEIFNLYSRNSNIAGGFGVGLSIVKQICDEFDIDIKLSSTLGKGSEFRLLLPSL
jgi:two-component system OmpR family sensor kinase